MRLLLTLLLATFAPNGLADIYKHLDPHGNPVYTDQPPENAEQVTLPKPNVLNADPAARDAAARYKKIDTEATRQAGAAPKGYTQLHISGVPDGQTLQNPTAPITMTALPEPPLKAGHKLIIYHNGEPTNTGNSHSINIPYIDRGSHVFVAEIRDAKGNVLITSAPTSFTVQRTSVIRRH